MKLEIAQKSYAGTHRRPNVTLEYFESENFVTICTPWGSSECGAVAAQTAREYFSTSNADPEATSPFGKFAHLSQLANTVRISTLVTHETVQQKYNKTSYTSGLEFLALGFQGREMAWVQVGQPHLLLFREGRMHPIQTASDLSFEFGNSTPMPAVLLGVERKLEFETRSLNVAEKDRVILLARAEVPRSFFKARFSGSTVQELTDVLHAAAAKEQGDLPFWLAVLAPNHLDAF